MCKIKMYMRSYKAKKELCFCFWDSHILLILLNKFNLQVYLVISVQIIFASACKFHFLSIFQFFSLEIKDPPDASVLAVT